MQTPISRIPRLLRRWPILLVALAMACGGGEGAANDGADDAPAAAESSSPSTAAGLSADELKYGIGSIRDLDLDDDLDDDLVARGAEIFKTKCSACHKLDERYVGPPLGGVTERREPEYVMNMILNTDEMVARHPEVKALLAQYYTPMPDQQLTDEDARAVLEYFRSSPAPAPEAEDGVERQADEAAENSGS